MNAILKSQTGTTAVEECRVLVHTAAGEAALDLRVWSAPLEIAGEAFTLFACQDIGNEKRRQFLERIFLHDLKNTTSALKGFLSLLEFAGRDEKVRDRYLQNVNLLSDQILDEIQSQRILLAAESGELRIEPTRFSSLALLQEVLAGYSRPDLMDGRRLSLCGDSADAELENDPTILKRVLGNMVKNAIEASVPGETVTLGCTATDQEVAFWVQNPTYMPENIRLQVFNRSFSTKGIGRGLGTFSMKFLTDRYLKGRIAFTSSEPEGTRFTATYLRRFPAGEP